MTTNPRQLLQWAPRVLGILVSLLVAAFALDAFSEGKAFADAALEFLVHLIPAGILLTLVAVSWRRPWIGALTFMALAVLYATAMARGRLDWVLVVSGPLLIVGALFLANWIEQRRHPLPS
jgi:hypothetical protein